MDEEARINKATWMRELSRGLSLEADRFYWNCEPELLADLTSGCGPGRRGDRYIPDTVWFLSITPACQIHDMDYSEESIVSKKEADRRFFDNMLLINEIKSRNRFIRFLRDHRICIYYLAVKYGGRGSFTRRH